jgi:hypothetical protein
LTLIVKGKLERDGRVEGIVVVEEEDEVIRKKKKKRRKTIRRWSFNGALIPCKS